MWSRNKNSDEGGTGSTGAASRVDFGLVGSLLRVSGTIAAVAGLAISYPANAQTLSEQLVSLTNDGCQGLGIPPSSIPNPDLGPQMQITCLFTSAGPGSGGGTNSASGGSSGGGGAGSYAVRRRLKELREGEDDDKQASENQVASLAETSIAQESFSSGKFSLFISGDFDVSNRDTTTFESGYDSNIWAVTVGGDYRITDALTAGIAANIGQQSGDFSSGGEFDTTTYGAVVYASYYPTALPGYFADLVLGYARKNFEVDRFTNGIFNGVTTLGISSSDTNGNELSSRLLLGKDFASGRFTFGPRAGVNFQVTDIDEATETGTTGLELVYDKRTVESLQSVLGVQATTAISTGIGVISPQLAFEWVHEFRSDQEGIDARFAQDLRPNPAKFSFQNEKPDRDVFNTRLGLVLVLPKGIQAFAEGRALVGHSFFTTFGGAIGMRLEL